MLNVSFRVDMNKLTCQTCLLRVTQVNLFLFVSRLGQPVYDLNLLRPNPNPQKPVSGSCHVRELGRILTPVWRSLTGQSEYSNKVDMQSSAWKGKGYESFHFDTQIT